MAKGVDVFTDRTDHDLDHLEPLSAVAVCCGGSVCGTDQPRKRAR